MSDIAPSNMREVSVSELSAAIKRTVEDAFGYVRLRGEVSGFKGPSSSGHAYFRLKDDRATIEAVIWKGTYGRLPIKPQEGLEVIATGRVTTFPGSSKYQIVIESLEPAGVGALMALLEERRKKLAAEGLFDAARKRALPYLPEVIGVVTSPTGAVIRDILHRLEDRFPRTVLVWPVRVQGEGSAAEVAAAIRGFNAIQPDDDLPRPDVLIVARGGGSLEDLWGFNEEIVVRAAFESAIPLISAVGHETDTTLIDYAADRRAPTPTAAAEMAVPVRSDLIAETSGLGRRMVTAVARGMEGRRTELRAATRALPDAERLLEAARQRLDAAAERLPNALAANAGAHRMRLVRAAGRLAPGLLKLRIDRSRDRIDALSARAAAALSRRTDTRRQLFDTLSARLSRSLGVYARAQTDRLGRSRERLDQLFARAPRALDLLMKRRTDRLEAAAKLLAALSYQGVLGRGFALVRDAAGKPLRTASAVASGQALTIEFTDGRVAATADGDAPPKPVKSAEPRPVKKKPEGQGSLF
ncbi:MAG: exodeoxyribonuclease VII large subunit [Phreatobacter sp.]|uniref:exodeoxyribonuclease VII large subunit n=1 Tax=Phreatobacter sp. TaxID=1966341 RepID=UPI001A619229|nr:exodeoxyribonuclease VII large subunit [Phreatobacter sp.]MBL8569203.1 exodeoxyribonuclease VII large subunit [Phreatobacter sp.]